MKQINLILDYVKENNYSKEKHTQFLKISNSIGDEAINFKLKQLLDSVYKKSSDYTVKELEKQKLELERKIEKLKANGRD